MLISLDYDETYTRDADLWDRFIANARSRGHKVFCVTMRFDIPKEADEVRRYLGEKVDQIIFTGRNAKKKFMYDLGYDVSVWIDDSPNWILNDAK